jgi:hypothetical protein
MVQASEPQASSASTSAAQNAEITSLKRQIYLCHHHKHHRRVCTAPTVMEKQVIIEKPVVVEKIVEKQVFVDRPAVIEKQIDKQVVVAPVEMERRVVVEHSAHRKHLLHFGIPFISVALF